MTPHEQRAWDRLTSDMAGDMHQYDYWQDVAENVRQIYLDRILLEDAARAAGIELVWSTEPDLHPRRKDSYATWNPLTDDGDALRLAIALDMALDLDEHPRATTPWADESMWAPFPTTEDKAANVRRCIVRAAAALADQQKT